MILKNEQECEIPMQETAFYTDVDSPRIKYGNSALSPCDVSSNHSPCSDQANRPGNLEPLSSRLHTSPEHSLASSHHHVSYSNTSQQQQQHFQTESVLPLQSRVPAHFDGLKHESEDQLSQIIDNTNFINLKITSSLEEGFLPSLSNLRNEQSDNYLTQTIFTNLQPAGGYTYNPNCSQLTPEFGKCIKPLENQNFPAFSHITGM